MYETVIYIYKCPECNSTFAKKTGLEFDDCIFCECREAKMVANQELSPEEYNSFSQVGDPARMRLNDDWNFFYVLEKRSKKNIRDTNYYFIKWDEGLDSGYEIINRFVKKNFGNDVSWRVRKLDDYEMAIVYQNGFVDLNLEK